MEYYISFALILALIIVAITVVVWFVIRKNDGKKSPCLIFASVDVVLTVIVGFAALFMHLGNQNFGSAIGLGLYVAFWIPVAAVLLVLAIMLHFVFR